MMNRRSVAILFILLFLVPVLLVHSAEWTHGRYWYFVENIKVEKGETPEILLWAALPIDHRGQTVKIGEIYPEPAQIIYDSINGNAIVFWQETELENKEQMFFFYDFQVLAERVETKIDPQKIIAYQKESEEYQKYTISEPWIEITPEIKEKAIEIVGKETNPYFQAKKIFDWVLENMDYEYPDVKERGAEISFKKLKGDCGEFSFVFSALCRAVNIPARTVTCIWFTTAGHVWAEILLPPYGWIPVDASVAQMMIPAGSKAISTEEGVAKFMESRGIPEKDPYYLFGNLYPNRVIVCIGNNIEAISDKTGIKRTFKFMQPGGATAFPPGIELKGLWSECVYTGFYLFGDKCDDMEFAMEKAQKELASSYLDAGLYDKAEKGFLRKLEENSDDALSWLSIGQVYMNKEDYDKAIEAFKKCIAGKAGSIKPVLEVWAHNLSGNCYDIKGMRELAIAEYNKVIDMNINFQGAVDSAKQYIKEPFEIRDE